jgi:hypothetical protein
MVKIEKMLQFEEVQGLLERAQAGGAVETAELNAVAEALELGSMETDALLWEVGSAGSSWSINRSSRRSRRNPPAGPPTR